MQIGFSLIACRVTIFSAGDKDGRLYLIKESQSEAFHSQLVYAEYPKID